MENYYPQSRKKNIVMQDLFDEVLIYDLEADKAFCLNHTSALIWQECDGTKSIAEIDRIVSQKLDASLGEDFIKLALNNLQRENLLENPEGLIFNSSALSRRALIKKIGATTMVALPVISSLVSPSPAAAGSRTCANSGEVCTDTFPCCEAPGISLFCFDTSTEDERRCFSIAGTTRKAV